MASLKRLPNGIWQVRWWTPDHRPAKKNFATKPEGQRFKTSLEHQLAQGAYIDINTGKRLFSDYAQDWLKVKAASVTERTWINQEGRLRNHLLPCPWSSAAQRDPARGRAPACGRADDGDAPRRGDRAAGLFPAAADTDHRRR